MFAAIVAFVAAAGIGANDVANAYATSVGSRALTVPQACFLAVIFEFAGAVLAGSTVTKTIRKGIADHSCYDGGMRSSSSSRSLDPSAFPFTRARSTVSSLPSVAPSCIELPRR